MRDSLFILDGLLEQQTSLRPVELMADTAGRSSARATASQLLSFISLGWPIVAPVLAATLPAAHRQDRRSSLAHALAGVLLSVAMLAAFSVVGALLPPAS